MKMASEGAQSFIDMPVKSVMTKDVKIAEVSKPLMECVAIMKRFNVGSVVVVEGNKHEGIIYERDFVRKLADGYATLGVEVGKMMSKPLTVISPNTTLWEAITLMGRLNIRRLPIVAEDRLEGILTETDVLRLIIAHQSIIIESVSESLPSVTREKLKIISGRFGGDRPTPRAEQLATEI